MELLGGKYYSGHTNCITFTWEINTSQNVLEEVKSTRGGDHGEMKTRTFPR